ncbi:MAG: IS3 family transposase [Oscillospiraceae bacterium]|nr:IS3 family transposase [Oscillospiraceae bacterium]
MFSVVFIEISVILKAPCCNAEQLEKPDKYAEIKEKIRHIYNKERYGYMRITAEFRKTHKVNHKTLQKLMHQMVIFCRMQIKYRFYKGEEGLN